MEAIYLDCGARRPQLKRNPLGSEVDIDPTSLDRANASVRTGAPLTAAILFALCALGSLLLAFSRLPLRSLLALLLLVLGIAFLEYARRFRRVRFTPQGILDPLHGTSMLWSEITEAHYDPTYYVLHLRGRSGRNLHIWLLFTRSIDEILNAVREHLPPQTVLT